jgi:hypothetical protein
MDTNIMAVQERPSLTFEYFVSFGELKPATCNATYASFDAKGLVLQQVVHIATTDLSRAVIQPTQGS